MRPPARRAALAAALAVGAATGCAYYNGMFNARRAERDALRFERQGRLAEASDQWQRAVAHAETLVTRHPRSRWAVDALLVSARARTAVRDFDGAAYAAQRALQYPLSAPRRAEALVLLGRADEALGRYQEALAELDSALATDPASRSDALLWRGLVLRGLGRTDSAVAALAASSAPRAAFERVDLLLQRHDTAAALAVADSLTGRRPYDEEVWQRILDTLDGLGAHAAASGLAGRLAARRDLTRGGRARLLLDDGRRLLLAHDTGGAEGRYRQAALVAPDSVAGEVAVTRLTLLAVPSAASEGDLDSLATELASDVALGGAPAFEAQRTAALLRRVRALRDDSPSPDAQWFLRAEVLRDSLGARPLAARTFAAMAARFPDSPWTPKALLAALALGHPEADSLRAVLDARYVDSPYRRAALGLAGASARYAALEDSLSRLLAPMLRRPGAGELELPGPAARPGGRVAAPRPPGSRPDTLE